VDCLQKLVYLLKECWEDFLYLLMLLYNQELHSMQTIFNPAMLLMFLVKRMNIFVFKFIVGVFHINLSNSVNEVSFIVGLTEVSKVL
jgi:hypothetical protein